MGIQNVINRFKEKKKQLAERVADRREIAKAERARDRQSRMTAISEARQLKREARAKHIKEKYGTYKPFSERVKDAAQSVKKQVQENQKRNAARSSKSTNRSNMFSRRPLSLGQGPIGNIGGPFGSNDGPTRDIITGQAKGTPKNKESKRNIIINVR